MDKWILGSICLFSAIVYSLTLQFAQAPDEHEHLAMSQFLIENRSLPVYKKGEASSALLSNEIGTWYGIAQANKLPFYDRTIQFTETIHGTREQEYKKIKLSRKADKNRSHSLIHYSPFYYLIVGIPYVLSYNKDILTRFYLMRLASILMFMLTLYFTYKIAMVVTRNHAFSFFSTLLVAMNPQFTHIMSSINNDAGVVLFATWLFYVLISTFHRETLSTGLQILTGFILAGVILSKLMGLILLSAVPAYYALKFFHFGLSRWKRYLLECTSIFSFLFLFSGWHFYRVYSMVGNFLGPSGTGVNDTPQIDASASLYPLFYRWEIKWRSLRILESFWAKFSWWNIHLYSDIFLVFYYLFFAVLGLIVLICIHKLVSRQHRFPRLIKHSSAWIFMFIMVFTVDYAYAFLTPWLTQGRYYFFVFPLMIILALKALIYFIPKKLHLAVMATLGFGLIVFNIKSFFHEILIHFYANF